VDTLIIESTYANRRHETVGESEEKLAEIVRRAANRGGKVLVPAFALGRVQELAYSFHQLFRAGKIPNIPVYIDSPLAVDATQVFRLHPDIFDRRERLMERAADLFDFPLVHYVREVQESKALNGISGPAVIIAASGMAESGRILHHLAHGIGDHRNIVLFVGFQAEHTLGRRIQSGAESVKIFGDSYERRAEVETIAGYSAHADREELRSWVRELGGPVKRAFVVHGEGPALSSMADLLKEEGVGEVIIPGLHESFEL
jgi:metallo-beta-lactamase family protein